MVNWVAILIRRLNKLAIQSLGVYVDIIQPQDITTTTQLYSKTGKAFKIQTEGDGDSTVTIMVTIGNDTYQFTGDKAVLDIHGSGALMIVASGSGKTPTIKILRVV